MFKDEYQAVCNAGAGKSNFLKKNPAGYMVSSMMAGLYIAFGSFVAFTLGQAVAAGGSTSFIKLAQSVAFASALSLIVMAGAELFTGNNFVMASAAFRKNVSWGDTAKLWAVCWGFNLIGSILGAIAFQFSGVPTANEGAVAEYFIQISVGKASLTPVNFLFRAILCNILVCLAVWCSIKLKSESGKLIMIFWCILVFMICGFEHSIADMSTVFVALINGGVTISQYIYVIVMATVGNMIGGVIFVALPYHIISKE